MDDKHNQKSAKRAASISGDTRDWIDVFLVFFALIFLPLGTFNALGHGPHVSLSEVLGLVFGASVVLAAFVTLLLYWAQRFIADEVSDEEDSQDIDPAKRVGK